MVVMDGEVSGVFAGSVTSLAVTVQEPAVLRVRGAGDDVSGVVPRLLQFGQDSNPVLDVLATENPGRLEDHDFSIEYSVFADKGLNVLGKA